MNPKDFETGQDIIRALQSAHCDLGALLRNLAEHPEWLEGTGVSLAEEIRRLRLDGSESESTPSEFEQIQAIVQGFGYESGTTAENLKKFITWSTGEIKRLREGEKRAEAYMAKLQAMIPIERRVELAKEMEMLSGIQPSPDERIFKEIARLEALTKGEA